MNNQTSKKNLQQFLSGTLLEPSQEIEKIDLFCLSGGSLMVGFGFIFFVPIFNLASPV